MYKLRKICYYHGQKPYKEKEGKLKKSSIDTAGKIIMILTKSPLPKKGRYGNEHFQDWYWTVVMANAIAIPSDTFLIVTGFKASEGYEYLKYHSELTKLNRNVNEIQVIPEGMETVDQLHLAFCRARDSHKDLIVVCTLMHFLRVWYICLTDKIDAEIKISFRGLPRPKEALTDIVLTFLLPVLDIFGMRTWFLNRVVERRNRGVL